jgi:hypothetical protein
LVGAAVVLLGTVTALLVPGRRRARLEGTATDAEYEESDAEGQRPSGAALADSTLKPAA